MNWLRIGVLHTHSPASFLIPVVPLRFAQLRFHARPSPHQGVSQVKRKLQDKDVIVDVISYMNRSNVTSMPLSKAVTIMLPHIKQYLAESGKGVEGFFKTQCDIFSVTMKNGAKTLSLTKNGEEYLSKAERDAGEQMTWEFDAMHEIPEIPSLPKNNLHNRLHIPTHEQSYLESPGGSIDTNLVLRLKLFAMIQPGKFYNVDQLFKSLYWEVGKASYGPFVSYFKEQSGKVHFEVYTTKKGEMFVAKKLPSRNEAAAKTSPSLPTDIANVAPILGKAHRVTSCYFEPNTLFVPTVEESFEVLRYTPAHFTDIHFCFNTPSKENVRIGSIVIWAANQPWFFDVKIEAAGKVMIRRAPYLNPKQFTNMTSMQAAKLLLAKVDSDVAFGRTTILRQLRETNDSNTLWERGVTKKSQN